MTADGEHLVGDPDLALVLEQPDHGRIDIAAGTVDEETVCRFLFRVRVVPRSTLA